MSLLNSRMQNIRSKSDFDKYERRPSQYGAFDLYAAQTESAGSIITQELKDKAFASIGSVLQTPVIDYDSGISISGSRSATIADAENTSQMVTISFATYSWGFTIVPVLYNNNEISMQEDFEAKFLKYLYLFAGTLDSAAIASLAAGKTQVFGNALGYTINSNTAISVWTRREELIGDLNVMMGANDYYQNLHVVGNSGIQSVIHKLQQHGVSNDQNKQLEYNDKILHWSNRIVNSNRHYGTGYIVNDGSCGILTRVEREALNRTRSKTGHEWDIDTLPLLNIPVGTYYYESVGDFNAIAGAASADMTRSWKQHYGFSVDVAMVTAYNSSIGSKAQPIMKFAIERNMNS